MSAKLAPSLKEIAHLDKAQCVEAWLTLTDKPAGKHLSSNFLRKALAFETQCKAQGGHSAQTKQLLRSHKSLKATGDGKVPPKRTSTLSSGSQLVREWNGRIYRVLVVDDRFEMDGQSYRSLSAVAKQITGAGWSGPRFFGLSKFK